ncbi:MAG TPA: hypothetical protein VGM88_10230 [Kofleriaceae bacterium]
MKAWLLAAATLATLPLNIDSVSLNVHSAAADPDSAIGVRVGGYGFRRDGAVSTQGDWNECRMNGFGLFGTRTVRGPLFLEGGIDAYFSAGTAESTDLPISRDSALLSVAIGLRTSFTPWLRAYVQVGGGAELTRLSVPYGDSTIQGDKVLPDAFVGFGGDLRILRATYIGMNIRAHAMGNFDYDPQKLQMTSQWVAAPTANTVFSASPDFAMQAQFYLRHDL